MTYQVLLSDPPWKYDFTETKNRKVENHYQTMTVQEICELGDKIATVMDPNSVLYQWATAPKLRESLQVMEAWGYEYKTHAIWNKEKMGMGYWWRGQHELLLVGTKGKMSPPAPNVRFSSIFQFPRFGHSKKPEMVYTMIDLMFPSAQKLELFGRGTAWGTWDIWGDEATNGITI